MLMRNENLNKFKKKTYNENPYSIYKPKTIRISHCMTELRWKQKNKILYVRDKNLVIFVCLFWKQEVNEMMMK
jgi:hypothetical protein